MDFIKQCQTKYGDTFTLHLAGRHLTFLMNPEDLEVFFSRDESVVDFRFATQPFLSRCFGVPKVHISRPSANPAILTNSTPASVFS